MDNKNETNKPAELLFSARELAHHIRYLGTSGFKNPDGSARVPTEQEVVDHGWEPQSYLTSPIPPEPRNGHCGLGKTSFLERQTGSDASD
jgi:hypothetical protein